MTTFRVWAPDHRHAAVRIAAGPALGDHPMLPGRGGWWSLDLPAAGAGTDYTYLLDGSDTALPDPGSRWQPHGVHGPSRVYDHGAYRWSDSAWTGRQLAGSVVYELHVGTFTPHGTLDAAVDRLDYLADLGVDMVELLPVNAFNGEHNWGYDGVLWYAVHEPYGGPDALKRFVDACHTRGLGVALDAVYNHLGPSGACLDSFGPYLTDGRSTWGRLVNTDGPGSEPVREYVWGSVRSWFADFHVDALRLDAVHALVDRGATHLLEEVADRTESLSAHLRRPLSLIAESDQNDPRLVAARAAGGYGLTAQWNDDVHHALHAALTGERQGYYADFGSLAGLAKTLTGVFLHDGTWSSFRGRRHGRPVDTDRTPGYRFLAYLHNHDQIGNRAAGDRLSARCSPGLLMVGAAVVLTSPYTPMLFMGEEWAAGTPWQFFTSHPEPHLAAGVGEGRRREFARHGWDDARMPDPQDPATFARSKLDWSELAREPHSAVLNFYRKLIALRRAHPDLSDPRLNRVRVDHDERARWLVVYRGRFAVVCNLGAGRCRVPVRGTAAGVALASEHGFIYTDSSVELSGESVVIVETTNDLAELDELNESDELDAKHSDSQHRDAERPDAAARMTVVR
ncbi:MAG TPA: malto-oligosyltrehalose trehalohydrolase [Mycobacteriales bacterium]|nr:malto-oligosyltrehalose trehalohydrolase [Mycobacteriales bacterium]